MTATLDQTWTLSKLGFKSELQKITGTHIIKVTPNLAEIWLLLNVSNRPLSENHVKNCVRRMQAGEWRLNGETIKFSNEGILLDGQHRLSALIQFGEPLDFEVRFGLEPEVFTTIDNGKGRTAADALAIDQIPYYNAVASAITIVWSIEKGLSQTNTAALYKLSPTETRDWYYEHPDFATYALQGMKWYGMSERLITPSEFAAFSYIFSKRDCNKSNTFFEKLALGNDLSIDNPVYVLRKKLLNAKADKTKKLLKSVRRAILIKAWNAYRLDKQIKYLPYDPTKEDFPKIL